MNKEGYSRKASVILALGSAAFVACSSDQDNNGKVYDGSIKGYYATQTAEHEQMVEMQALATRQPDIGSDSDRSPFGITINGGIGVRLGDNPIGINLESGELEFMP